MCIMCNHQKVWGLTHCVKSSILTHCSRALVKEPDTCKFWEDNSPVLDLREIHGYVWNGHSDTSSLLLL
jgi:hypothetical protein